MSYPLAAFGPKFALSERSQRFATAALKFGSWGLLLAALGQWIIIGLLGDVTWFGTVVLFAPRWPLLIPIAGISAVCLFWRRRLLWVNLAGAMVVAGPVMGFCVPWGKWFTAYEGQSTLKVLSCNCGGGFDEASLVGVLAAERPDIVALQEWPSELPFPTAAGPSWTVERRGTLLIASKHPIHSPELIRSPELVPWRLPALRCEIETPHGAILFVNVHLDTPREGIETVLHVGWDGADEVVEGTRRRRIEHELVSEAVNGTAPTIIAGDFNTPCESRLYRAYWSEYQNAFATAGLGYGYTKHTRWHGVRIDHVLANEACAIKSCKVVSNAGGDHRPVVADLVLEASR